MDTPTHLFISYARDEANGAALVVRLQTWLEARGLPCWRDESDIKPGQSWPSHIPDALKRARAMICVINGAAKQSQWVKKEILLALKEDVPILPVLAESGCDLPFTLIDFQPLDLSEWDEAQLEVLLSRIRNLDKADSGPARRVEVAYLQNLLHREGLEKAAYLYEPLEGDQYRQVTLNRILPGDEMEVAFDLLRDRHIGRADTMAQEPQHFDDVLEVLGRAPRLVVLGEPGAGKTHSLKRIAAELARGALEDGRRPLPLFIPLGKWIEPKQTLDDYLSQHLEGLGAGWQQLLAQGRVALLLDGLNELPTNQREVKIPQIRKLTGDQRLPVVAASCRKDDFEDHRLDLDRLEIQPLDEPRILRFCQRHFRALLDPETGDREGEKLFWRLAGGEEVRAAYDEASLQGVSFEQFWQVAGAEPVVLKDDDYSLRWRLELGERAKSNERGLLQLARNPYLLKLLAEVFLNGGRQDLPRNRAQLFADFVAILLWREDKRHQDRDGIAHPGRADAEEALGRFAWELQNQAGNGDKVQLAMGIDQAKSALSAEQLNLARDASLLEVTDTVRFTHQLLQEYFVALGMQARIAAGKLPAEQLWPADHWWRRNGWEEAAVFLAGLSPDDPTLIVDWLSDAHPGLLLQCIEESGCAMPNNAQLADLRNRWLPRLVPEVEPAPEARHQIALALGALGLDRRPGVLLDEQGWPDIDWVEIPGGEFIYGENESQQRLTLDSYFIARYPITNAQYQSFIDDGGYEEERWWRDLERQSSPEKSRWNQPNRPRETVSWFEAVAFCRWFSQQLGYAIRLPTEQEWEKAARGTDGREYPWGNGYRAGYANVDEKEKEYGLSFLEQTTAVGLYPQGTSPYGVMDMAGNVSEWCLNKYDDLEETAIDVSRDVRVLRGGAWVNLPELARAALRFRLRPDLRHDGWGFRVVCASPILR
ncbi:MAG: SUMF1/EgtB/PvdO family nonheme iron enzyme [Candidatus Thiodiazotropha sp.]